MLLDAQKYIVKGSYKLLHLNSIVIYFLLIDLCSNFMFQNNVCVCVRGMYLWQTDTKEWVRERERDTKTKRHQEQEKKTVVRERQQQSEREKTVKYINQLCFQI